MQNLTEVINWRRLSEKITLSGQPTEEQLSQIKNLGVSHIINLGPHHNDGALEDEAGTVAALGMKYIYIPVEFDRPTDEDFKQFCEEITKLEGCRIHVHCIYNARVSAFFYRYAKSGFGGSEEEAHALMDGIWRPGNDWAQFIGNMDAIGKPNQYAGYDY